MASVLAAAALVAWGVLAPSGALAAGWLAGLLFWLGASLGAMALLALEALTGGAWAQALRPALGPAAALLPVCALLAVPLLPALPALYPWVADPGAATHPAVARFYLNPMGWTVRTGVALLGWSAFGLLLARPGPAPVPLGVACLVFHAVALTVLGVDWVLSLEPRFRSSAIALALGVGQVLAALAWAAVRRPEPPGDAHPGQAGDLGALLLAGAIGGLYLGFVQFLVSWYGNLPDKAAWYLARQQGMWLGLGGLSLLLAGGVPVAALLLGRVRRSPAALRWIGLGVLLGLLAHAVWLVGPSFGPAMLPAAALAALAIGGLWVGLARGPLAARLGERAHGAA